MKISFENKHYELRGGHYIYYNIIISGTFVKVHDIHKSTSQDLELNKIYKALLSGNNLNETLFQGSDA